MEAEKRPHISPSQVRMMDFCPQQWWFRYALGMKTPPGFVLVEGSATHKAAEVNNLQKIESHEDLPVKVLQEAAVAEVEKRVREEGLDLTKDEEFQGRAKVVDSIKDSVALNLVPLYHADIAPKIQPELVEEKVLIELPNHTHDLLGIMDVATTDGTVRDLKVTGRSKTQNEADTSLQLTWYHVAYGYVKGHPPQAVGLDVLVKTKTPKTQWIPSYRDDGDIDILLGRINQTVDMIGHMMAGTVEPKPAPFGHPMCSPKFCGFHAAIGGPCKHVSATRKIHGGDE